MYNANGTPFVSQPLLSVAETTQISPVHVTSVPTVTQPLSQMHTVPTHLEDAEGLHSEIYRELANRCFRRKCNRQWHFSCTTKNGGFELKRAFNAKVKRYIKIAAKKKLFDENALLYLIARSAIKTRNIETIPLFTEFESSI